MPRIRPSSVAHVRCSLLLAVLKSTLASNGNLTPTRERLLAKHFPVVRRLANMSDAALVWPAVNAYVEDCGLPTFYRRMAAGLLQALRPIGTSRRVRGDDYSL